MRDEFMFAKDVGIVEAGLLPAEYANIVFLQRNLLSYVRAKPRYRVPWKVSLP